MTFDDTREFLNHLKEAGAQALRLEPASNKVCWESDEGPRELALPLVISRAVQGASSISDVVDRMEEGAPSYVIVLMRAGSASLGCYNDGELIAHKVIRKYMVRKKQGKAQISYLQQKGKSRAGSRVRLRESVEFFEEINQKISDWFEDFGEPELIFYSCPVRLKAHWLSSKVEPPFSNDDSRLVHVPFHVHQPDHDELLRINRLLASAVVTAKTP